MPRYGPFIHQVYIADGFADDCDELIHRCLKAERFDYQVFCKIWKEMNMGCLYEGRTLCAEIAELSEEVIHIGKHYMLKDISNFEESVIGVFIVYALLHLQPYKGFAHLRLVPQDLPAINRIEHVARRDKRYDVLYALGSILIKGPVQYHAAEREYGMDLAVRKYLEGFTSIDKLGLRPKGVFRRQNEELDILKELQTITQQYTQAKMMISNRAQFDRNLKYIDPNLPFELEASLKKIISGIHDEQYGYFGEGKSGDDSDKISKSRRAIKDKAMKQDVKPVRHLVNSKYRKSSSPKKEESITSPKNKTRKSKSNKDKSPNTNAQRKRRIPISPRALKKSRNNVQFEEGKDSTSENDESDRTENDSPTKLHDDYDSIELPEEIVAAISDMKESNTEVKNEEENEQELDIEIDTLPVIIRTEDQGKLFEIEIIDKKEPAKNAESSFVKTYKKKESAFKKISKMPGLSIEKITDAEIVEPVASTSSADDFARIIEINEESGKNKEEVSKVEDKQGLGIPSSKIEKRDCKRVHLQSKFKRLGMLPIANFDSPDDIASDEIVENDLMDEPEGNLGLMPIED